MLTFCSRHPHLCANLMLIGVGVGAHLLTSLVYFVACWIIAVLFHSWWIQSVVKQAYERSIQGRLDQEEYTADRMLMTWDAIDDRQGRP